MKVLYVKQNLFPVGEQIEHLVSFAFKNLNYEYDAYELNQQFFLFQQALSSIEDLKEQNVNQLSLIYASLLIPKIAEENQFDAVFFLNGEQIDTTTLEILKKIGKKVIVWHMDDPYWIDRNLEIAEYCDYIFTCDSAAVGKYNSKNSENVYYLPMAGAALSLEDVIDKKFETDICFIGTPFKDSKRVKLIDELAPFLKDYNCKIIGSHVVGESWKDNLKNYDMLKDFIIEEFIPMEDSVKYIVNAKINLNLHRDSFGHRIDRNADKVQARSPNERTFFITGCNAFQLVDNSRPDIYKHFEKGREIVAFEDTQDLKKKIIYYIENEEERKKIAAAAYERLIKEHTYEHRLHTIFEKVQT